MNPNENPYFQIKEQYPTIRNYPAFSISNKHNRKPGKLIFANPETKDKFLRNEAITNETRLNMKSDGIAQPRT